MEAKKELTGFTPLEVQPTPRLDNSFSANSPAAQFCESKQPVVKLLTGFTLIELLVVVSIIGILLLASTSVLSESRARGRDAKRVTDIRVLHEALAMYNIKFNNYPVQTTEIALNAADPVQQSFINEGILNIRLLDPKTGQTEGANTYDYYYSTTADGVSYTLRYCQETTAMGLAADCANQVTQ